MEMVSESRFQGYPHSKGYADGVNLIVRMLRWHCVDNRWQKYGQLLGLSVEVVHQCKTQLKPRSVRERETSSRLFPRIPPIYYSPEMIPSISRWGTSKHNVPSMGAEKRGLGRSSPRASSFAELLRVSYWEY
jgi:hypothetical protein